MRSGSPTPATAARSSRPRPLRSCSPPTASSGTSALWALPELPEPERIFQLDEPGLGGDFPALRARPGATPVRVVLADDSVLLREGVARLLDDAGFDVVAQSGNADDLLRHVAMHKPDVAVVDIRMPPTQTDEGLRAAKEIRESHPEVGVLVLSQYVEPGYAMELLSDSAERVGYLLKDRVADIDEFAAAVRRVAEGGSALDPAVVSQLVGRAPPRRPARRALATRARGAGADGRGPLEPGDRGAPRSSRCAPSRST